MPAFVHRDALFVALVLAPTTYSRNRYFDLFRQDEARHARRRAQMVRSLVRDLTEPWPHPGRKTSGFQPQDFEEARHPDGVTISYAVPEFQYRRYAVLSALESATLRYAVAKTRQEPIAEDDRQAVESALARLQAV